jgi:hypothetical protein
MKALTVKDISVSGSNLKLFVSIGAMKFPVRASISHGTEGEMELKLDFGKTRPVKKTGIPTSQTVEENSAKESGLFLSDILNLVDQNPTADPFITLSLSDIETHLSRIVGVTMEGNTPGDGVGGVLWLNVEEKFKEPMSTAVAMAE